MVRHRELRPFNWSNPVSFLTTNVSDTRTDLAALLLQISTGGLFIVHGLQGFLSALWPSWSSCCRAGR